MAVQEEHKAVPVLAVVVASSFAFPCLVAFVAALQEAASAVALEAELVVELVVALEYHSDTFFVAASLACTVSVFASMSLMAQILQVACTAVMRRLLHIL